MYSRKRSLSSIPAFLRKRSRNEKTKINNNNNFGFWSAAATFHDEKINTTNNSITCISGLFIPIVKYLRLMGFCPLSIKQDPVTTSPFFEFRWQNFFPNCSLILSIFYSVGAIALCSYLAWTGFTNDFQHTLQLQRISLQNGEVGKNRSFVAEFGTRVFPAMFPLFAVILSSGTLYSVPGLKRFLNGWPLFQLEYIRTFPFRCNNDDPFIDIKKYRRRAFLISPIYCILSLVSVGLAFKNCESCHVFSFLKYNNSIITTTMACSTIFLMVGSNFLHSLMFITLVEVFKQIRLGIVDWTEQQQQGTFQQQQQRDVYEEVKKWSDLIMLGKKQVSTVGEAISLHQVLMIFINFLYLCLGVFTCFVPTIGEGEKMRGLIILMFSIWGFCITIGKALTSDKIRNEERLITKQLINLNVHKQIPAMVQINNLVYLINESPAEIRFYNVLTLNKSFLVQLFGQVATYLIVLIQFDNVQRDGFR